MMIVSLTYLSVFVHTYLHSEEMVKLEGQLKCIQERCQKTGK